MLIWGDWHFSRQIKTLKINPAEIQFFSAMNETFHIENKFSKESATTQLIEYTVSPGEHSGSSTHLLVVDMPGKIRVGDADFIHLSISPDESAYENNTSPESEDDGSNPGAALPAIYSTHNLLTETRLEMDGMLFEPTGDVIVPFQPERTLSVYFTVQPQEAGAYHGVLWLHFQYVAKDGSETLRRLISRQSIELEAVSLGGLRGDTARFLGVILIFIGLALDIDFIIMIFQKFKRQPR